MKILSCGFALVAAALILGGCAAKVTTPYTPVTHKDLGPKVAAGEYEAKVDNFLLLLDSSSSMSRPHTTGTRYETAQGLAAGLNETLPELSWSAGVRAFGPHFARPFKRSALVYGMTPHKRADLAAALDTIPGPAGTTPLATALTKSGDDLAPLAGKSALVIFTDGEVESADDVLRAAAQLRNRFEDRLCVYPVMVGDSTAGSIMLERLVENSACGFVSRADELASGDALAAFATEAFLQKAPPAPVAVAPPVAKEPVFRTETVRLAVNFAFDSAEIRPDERDDLARFADFLKKYPEKISTVEIAGHTCNMGPAAYNLGLSQRRAESVVKHLVDNHGVDPALLKAKGYGMTKPIASNDTPEGREQNRRVEAVISVEVKENK
ncbi:OmpA family protein [Desulfurivibrio sp. C05AmB]|uniref:OmpA family protein n=1 Tax=Desulfurivibrio sp. C05AmB TaxID=3374371 RepID=UPI00376F12C7